MANPQSKSYAEIFAKNVTLNGTLTVTGATVIAGITLTNLTATGNIQLGNAASDTIDLQSLTTVKTNQKIQFRDTGLYIYSSADGQLDVIADTVAAITAPTITLTGSTAISLAGGVTITAANTFATGTGAVSINGDATVAAAKRLYFRDTGLNIYSSADGVLDLVSDTTLAITAPASTITGTLAITSASATSFAVGRLGSTTPAFVVDSSTASQVAGLKITGAATGGTVAIAAIDSGADASLSISAKGAGLISFGTKLTGQIYVNDTGKTAQTLKIHNHLNTSEIGGGEFKGEFLNTTGTVDGVASHWSYEPTGATGAPDAVRAGIYNMTLSAANTMTAGWIAGLQGSTIISGTLNGAAICEFGVLGVVDGAGTRTLVQHTAGLASVLHVAAGDEPATGELSMLYMSSDYGGTVDNAIYIGHHELTTNFLNLEGAGNTGFVTTGGTDCTASGATDPSFTLKCIMPGGAAGYIRVWAAA